MDDSRLIEQSIDQEIALDVCQEEEQGNSLKKKLIVEAKKLHNLEKKLINSLVDPFESDYRRRYIKRWIYGEEIKE